MVPDRSYWICTVIWSYCPNDWWHVGDRGFHNGRVLALNWNSCDLEQNTLIWCFSGDSFHYLALCLLIFVLLHVTLHAACLCPLPSTTEEVSCEFGSSKYYALCGFGGILSCGLTHTAVVPLDLVKCRLQVCMEAEPPSSQHLRQPLKPSTNEYVSKEPTNYCIF